MEWHQFLPSIGHLPARSNARIKKAFELGRTLHEGQTRKSGEPYFTHPMAVAAKLAEAGGDEDTIIAALLHDTVEDTPATLEDIERKFGPVVKRLIDGVTKLSSSDISGPKVNEQTETLRKIFRLMQEDSRIMVIKLYDRLHNMETATFLSESKRMNLAKETLDVYVKIADRLCMQDLRYALEGLCLQVLQPDLYSSLLNVRDRGEVQGRSILLEMEEVLMERQLEHLRETTMELEKKTWGKLEAQLNLEGNAVSGISPVTIAFVCKDIDSCYRVLGSLHGPWRREVLSFQDFINSPMVNGYRGLHTTVILSGGTRVRCKIRTKEMQEYAHKGVTLYCFDPKKQSQLFSLLPWTERMESLVEETAKRSDDFWESLQNDILGETVTIYGPDDRMMDIPKGSTALDGAFYLFRTSALRTVKILVNGKEVPFGTKLSRGNAIEIVQAAHPVADHAWLEQTSTQLAKALIRENYLKMSTMDKVKKGLAMLQAEAKEHKQGFVEELHEAPFAMQLHSLGYTTFEELFVGLAEGRLDAPTAYRTLFRIEKSPLNILKKTFTITFCLDVKNMENIQQILRQQVGNAEIELLQARMKTLSPDNVEYTLKIRTEIEGAHHFLRRLQAVNAMGTEMLENNVRHKVLLGFVISLWAANPVMAQLLLRQGMDLTVLSTIRMLTFAAFNITFFLGWLTWTRTKYRRIPFIGLIAALPASINALLMFSTYLALQSMPPSVHLAILRFNALLVPRSHSWSGRTNRFIYWSCTIALFLCSVGAFWYFLQGNAKAGIFFSVLSLLSYTLYSGVTEHVIRRFHIGVRHPLLSFWIGLLFGIGGIGIWLFLPSGALYGPHSLSAVLYTLVFVCVPYLCYTALLKAVKFRHFTDLLIFEVPIALFLEYYLIGRSQPLAVYWIMSLTIGLIALLRWRSGRMTLATDAM